MRVLRAVAAFVLLPVAVSGLVVMLTGGLLVAMWTRSALTKEQRRRLATDRAVKELMKLRDAE